MSKLDPAQEMLDRQREMIERLDEILRCQQELLREVQQIAQAATEQAHKPTVEVSDIPESTTDADTDADTTASEQSSDVPRDSKGHILMEQAFEEAGFYVKKYDYDHPKDEHVFQLGHDDFDELKRVTSECELVDYDGENNRLHEFDAAEYVREVLLS